MVIAFRLYGQPGCPHCEAAELFLTSQGMAAQIVPIGNDPVALQGIKAVTGKDQPEVPILVSFITNEVVGGFKENDYKRLAGVFNSMYRSGASNPSGSQGDNIQPPETVVAEPTPSPEGVA